MKTIRLMLRLTEAVPLAGVSKSHRVYTPADRERNRCRGVLWRNVPTKPLAQPHTAIGIGTVTHVSLRMPAPLALSA